MRVRLLADDLTGALDTAARFVARTGPVPVFWAGPGSRAPSPGALPPSAALDAGTREMTPEQAAATAADLAAALAPGPGVVAYQKLDSLLRGHAAAELAAVLRRLPVRRCVVAPAFPFQGRITRGGVQHARTAEGWRPVGESLRAALAEWGVSAAPARPGDPVPEGVSLWDAETDADLAAIAAAGRALDEPVLWCGSGGLAGALAGPPPAPGHPDPAPRALARPVLGLFGSDHPTTAAQLHAAGPHVLRLPDGGSAAAEAVTRRLASAGVALVAFGVPPGLSRPEAAAWIAREMDTLTRRLVPPRTLVVAGGETLRSLCLALGAGHLEVHGQFVPGVPRAVLCGGRWDGTEVVSKSGAFGEAGLLARLLLHGAPQEEPSA